MTRREEQARRRFADLSSVFVEHPRYMAAYRRARMSVLLGGAGNEAPCVQLSGPPGVGKSTIGSKLLEEFPKVPDSRVVHFPRSPPVECDHIPILVFSTPTKPTVKSLLHEALKAFGDPEWAGTSVSLMTDRFDRFVEGCATRAVVIDNMHRAVDRGGVVISDDIAELLTARHDANAISLILLGLGRMEHLFSADLQLARRWDAEVRLEPYRWVAASGEPHKDQLQFTAILEAFMEACPFRFDEALDPCDEEVAYRFFYASRGVIGLLKSILLRVVRLMGEEAIKPPVTSTLLARAYDEAIRGELRTELNPFALDFTPDLRAAPPALPDDKALLLSADERRRNKNRRARGDKSRRARSDELRARLVKR